MFLITEDQVKWLYNFLLNLPARDSYPMLRMLEMLPPYDKKMNIEDQPNENPDNYDSVVDTNTAS